jgi:hypothetical protein
MSEIFKRILSNTYRKVEFYTHSISDYMITGINKRYRYIFDIKSFNVGLGFCKTTGSCGWKYMLSFDLGFFSCWIFFVELKND